MSELLNGSFYDPGLDRDLDFEIKHFNGYHLELTSFPQEVYIPSSDVTITTLYVSKDLPLPEFYHVTWVINDEVITQVFGTEVGCFEEKDHYIVTCRYKPATIHLTGIKTKDLFRHAPRVTPYHKNGDEVIIHESPKKIKIRLHFKRIMSALDYIWEGVTTYIPAYFGLVSILTEHH